MTHPAKLLEWYRDGFQKHESRYLINKVSSTGTVIYVHTNDNTKTLNTTRDFQDNGSLRRLLDGMYLCCSSTRLSTGHL